VSGSENCGFVEARKTKAHEELQMKGHAVSLLRFACALFVVITAGWFLVVHAAKPAPQGFPTDWTHRHLVFSRPASVDEAQRVAQDTRYWQQWYRRANARSLAIPSEEEDSASSLHVAPINARKPGLWEENLGTNATSGAANYPAKYSFQVTVASCSDYVVFNTGVTGASNQASIVAYTNLYSGCSGNGSVPSVYWAYNTGGQVLTSPGISGDGTQIAFVQTNGTIGSLVLVKFAASGGTASAPAAITSVPNSAYRTCTAPCITSLTLENTSSVGINDTTSSVFADYTHDVIYVGGASSWLFKFSGVFRGTPAEVTTGGFPLQVNATTPTALTSPIYDFQSGNVFVSDSGGYLYKVSSTGGVTSSAKLDHGAGIVAAPIVDSTAELVYAFSSNDASTNCAGAACAAIYVFKVGSFPTVQSEGTVGTASAAGGNPLYEPDFDNTYVNSTNGTGNVYICGATGAAPILYQVPISAATFGTSVALAILTPNADHRACSPVTDIYNPNAANGPAESVFFSVQNNGRPLACGGGGCALSFVDMQWQESTNYNVGQEVLILRPQNGALYSEIAIQKGESGVTTVTWPTAAGVTTTDGTVKWLSQGATTVANTSWTADNNYGLHNRIVVTVGSSIYYEAVTTAGTSAASEPAWNTTLDGTTTDGGVTWTNIGIPYSVLSSKGGTSGIIYDNLVSSSKEAGASQVYFSTLGSQTCTTSASTGGCAIQASQSALQ
jgi:hypothetical protein